MGQFHPILGASYAEFGAPDYVSTLIGRSAELLQRLHRHVWRQYLVDFHGRLGCLGVGRGHAAGRVDKPRDVAHRRQVPDQASRAAREPHGSIPVLTP